MSFTIQSSPSTPFSHVNASLATDTKREGCLVQSFQSFDNASRDLVNQLFGERVNSAAQPVSKASSSVETTGRKIIYTDLRPQHGEPKRSSEIDAALAVVTKMFASQGKTIVSSERLTDGIGWKVGYVEETTPKQSRIQCFAPPNVSYPTLVYAPSTEEIDRALESIFSKAKAAKDENGNFALVELTYNEKMACLAEDGNFTLVNSSMSAIYDHSYGKVELYFLDEGMFKLAYVISPKDS
jgi:hypothetical protein